MISGPTAPGFTAPTTIRRPDAQRAGGGDVAAPVYSERPLDDPEQTQETRRAEEQSRREVQQLQARDREVRAHERSHIAAGGQYIRGGAQFTYQKGPDGRLYAVGGEVSIDSSPVPNNPEATLQKAQVIQRAALAPQEPSGQDRTVAAQARQMAVQARIEIARQQAEERQGQEGTTGTALDTTGGTSSDLASEPDPLLDAVI